MMNNDVQVNVNEYGMRLRGFSPGCQPMKGLIERRDDPTGRYYDILVYAERLTDEEVAAYELDYIGEISRFKTI